MAHEDSALAARVRAGDAETIRSVVRAHLPEILRAARGAGLDPTQAEDVTQATFTTFVEKAYRFEGRSQVRTWLFGILYKKIAEYRRALGKAQKHDDIDEVVESRFDHAGGWMRPPRPVDEELAASEIRGRIQDCLENLPETQNAAFRLREVDGFSTQEICKILDVTRTNLGVLLYRARNRLRECLESKGVKGSGDVEL